ncbi:YbhB/YbcL family Raf kinase inhibitor-like protein, partial [Klebsiella pneumoniae]
LKEGDIAPDDGSGPDGEDVGRNSRFVEGWLPPDPPNGHGEHNYAFQLFALSEGEDPGGNPGRGAILRAMEGRV